RQVLLNSASPQILGDAFVAAARDLDVDGHLVMITSGAATSVYEGWSAYGPGKAAVDHWVRTVGAERERRGSRLRVISVAPGTVATAMQAEIRDTPERDFPNVGKFIDLHEAGDLVAPEDAARGIWSLLDRDLDNGSVVDLRDLD
ncbi:MAG: SDR family NAD(P)-dependent oxidoreductase, partial [Actinomycetota bacterium]|nr:SDR family NAD(P)-dependent oxidoreductase [Actinomycetota bacterium]